MTTKEKFDSYIYSFLTRINPKNRNDVESPLNKFSSQNILSSDFIYDILSTTPEMLFREVGEHQKSFKNQFEIWNPKKINNLSNVKGVLSCHALSPYGDTIFLLADLGRALRTSATIKKEFRIMLANENWSEYNWVATEIGDHNLNRSLIWRTTNLYNKIGAIVDKSDLTTITDVTKEQIMKIGTAYEDLVRSIFGSNYIGRKLYKKEIEPLMDKYRLYSNNDDKIDFLNISLIKEKLKPEKEVIMNVLRTLKRFDQRTFIYYFTQRFQQYKYKDYLKVAVRSEKNFDIPFYSLDKTTEKKGVSLSIYFENYKLYKDKFVIPYYFPSGSLYEDKNKLDSYKNEVIMLDDFNNKQKIKKILDKMNYPYNARLISDFLSFLHFLLYPIDNNQGQNEYRTKFKKIINKYSEELKLISEKINNTEQSFELIDSWNFYVKTPTEFNKRISNWSRCVFISDLKDKLQLPYYYFPFIDLLSKQKKEIYYNMFADLLKETIIIIDFPQYHKY